MGIQSIGSSVASAVVEVSKQSAARPASAKPVAQDELSDFSPAQPPPVSIAPKADPRASVGAALGGNTFRILPGSSPAYATLVNTESSDGHSGPALTPESAAKVVEDAYRSNGAASAAAILHLEAETLGSKEQVDALLARCKPLLQKMAQELAATGRSDAEVQKAKDLLSSLASVAAEAGPAGQQQLAKAIADAIQHAPKGEDPFAPYKTSGEDLAFSKLLQGGEGAELFSQVLAQLQRSGAVPQAELLRAQLADGIQSLRHDYQSASDEKARLDARLASDLATYGPGLTAAQKRKYVAAFWKEPDHQKVLDAYDASADRLSTALAADAPVLEQLAKQGDAAAAKALQSGYEDLSRNDAHAKDALAYVATLNRDAALAHAVDAATGGKLSDQVEDLLANALPRAQSQVLASNVGKKGGFKAATAELQQMLAPILAGKNFAQAAKEVATLKSTLAELSSGHYDGAKALLAEFPKTKLGISLKAFAVAQGIYKSYEEFGSGEPRGAIVGFLESAHGGLALTAGVLNTLGKADAALGVARLTEKLDPYVALIADGNQLADDIRSLRKGATLEGGLDVAGDALGIAGDVLDATGFLAEAGVVLKAAGELLHALSGLISAWFGEGDDQEKQVLADRDRLLRQAGVPDETRKLLERAPSFAAQLSTLKLSPERFFQLLKELPDKRTIEARMQACEVAAALGYHGEQAFQFIEKLTQSLVMHPDALSKIRDALQPLTTEAGSNDGIDPKIVTDAARNLIDVLPGEVRDDFGLDEADPYANGRAFEPSYFTIAGQLQI